VFMRYIALDTVEHHIERVKRRAAGGGHSASETTLAEFMPAAWGIRPSC